MHFENQRTLWATANSQSSEVNEASLRWHNFSRTIHYQYLFDWCGVPIIQDPQDIIMLHEVLWRYKPNLIIETGIARGGSLLLSASVLASWAFIDSNFAESQPKVIGIDIDIRKANRLAIESHPLGRLIHLIEGSSIDPEVVAAVLSHIDSDARVAIVLDSDHSHNHVLSELMAYSPLVRSGGPIVVMDTGIEFAPESTFREHRHWGVGNSPYTAVQEFLAQDAGRDFVVDQAFQVRHLITSARDGLLRRK